MADEEDITALEVGETDLVRRDFRNADLSNRNIGFRDFSHALLDGTKFSKSNISNGNFERAKLFNTVFESAVLTSTKWRGAIFAVNFQGADLRGSKFERSAISRCDFRGSDLRGASFAHSDIGVDSKFDNAVVDESTIFDEAKVLRSTARQEAFRFYEVHRGVLRRIAVESIDASSNEKADLRADLISRIDSLQSELRRIEYSLRQDNGRPSLGHNNPPEDVPLERGEYFELQDALGEIKEQANAKVPNKEIIDNSQRKLESVGEKILRWSAGHCNAFADEFSKGLGRNLSNPINLAIAWSLISVGIAEVIHITRSFFGN